MAWLTIAAAAASTFNLACGGVQTIKSISDTKVDGYKIVYRIDLDKKLYCENECKAQRPIANVGPTQITLIDENTDGVSEERHYSDLIDRQTGAHHVLLTHKSHTNRFDISILKNDGTCERQPFTGFPTFDTKF